MLLYPSTELAMLHMEANRLGTLDLAEKKKKDGKKEQKEPLGSMSSGSHMPKEEAANFEEKKDDIVYCLCCGLPRQTETLSMCTNLRDIKALGISTRLFFYTY